MSRMPAFLRNCLWLWVPPLAISFALWGQLGPAYQREVFWQDIPPLLGRAENVFRFAVIAICSTMIFQFKTKRHRLGLSVYLIGVALFAASYIALIIAPKGQWAESFLGFVAPAYTPLVWIIGIGLIGDQSFLLRAPRISYVYYTLATGFLITHIIHTALVFSRSI